MTLGEFAHFLNRSAHITGGLLALGAGMGAMIYKKGSPMHKQHGTVFFLSMITLGTTGFIGAVFLNPIAANQMGAMMALYLTSTAWLTVWREPGKTGRLEILAALWGIATIVAGLTFGVRAMNSPRGVYQEFNDVGYFVFAGIATLGVALDVRALARGGLLGTSRTTRHLWRMLLAFFMATGSFFIGQARQFSPEIRETGLLPIPALAPLVLLVYWLIRVRVVPVIRKAWTLRRPPREIPGSA